MIRTGASIVELRGVSHARSADGESAFTELRDLSLSFARASFTVVRGGPASGKNLLLRLLGLFEPPDDGALLVEGRETQAWSEEERAEMRAHRLGLLFSAPFLLPSLTVAENIAMPIFRLSGADPEEAGRRAEELLAFAGLAGRAQTAAGDLTQEEQYAAAIARALAHQPPILLVDEIDATLEGESLRRIATLLRQAAEQKGAAVIASSCCAFSPEFAHRTLDLVSGRLEADTSLPRVGTA